MLKYQLDDTTVKNNCFVTPDIINVSVYWDKSNKVCMCDLLSVIFDAFMAHKQLSLKRSITYDIWCRYLYDEILMQTMRCL